MRLEEVLKQNYMWFILRLRDDEQKYDHFEWFAKGRFEEVYNVIKRLAIHDAMLKFNDVWKDDMDYLRTRRPDMDMEIKIFSNFTNENIAIILDSNEDELVVVREYVRSAFGVRLWQLGMDMNKSYDDMLQRAKREKREKELKEKRWQTKMVIETIEQGKRDIYYGGTERKIKNAYYEYYYNMNDDS